jgi:hypothetical protein
MTLIPIMQASPITNSLTPSTINNRPSTILYTCPMASHDVVLDKPGKCPKCDMDLVPTSTVPHGKAMEEKWRKEHRGKP